MQKNESEAINLKPSKTEQPAQMLVNFSITVQIAPATSCHQGKTNALQLVQKIKCYGHKSRTHPNSRTYL